MASTIAAIATQVKIKGICLKALLIPPPFVESGIIVETFSHGLSPLYSRYIYIATIGNKRSKSHNNAGYSKNILLLLLFCL